MLNFPALAALVVDTLLYDYGSFNDKVTVRHSGND